MTARRWVFTIQVPEGLGGLTIPWNPNKMSHLVYQLERAPTTGQLHLQGYVHLSSPMRMAGVKRLLGHNAHLEECMAPERAILYAKKEETRVDGPWEHGSQSTQGTRTDLKSAVELVVNGKRPREIATEAPLLYARFSKNIAALRAELVPARQRDNLKVICLWGETRTGKTRSVYDLWSVEDVYRVFDLKNCWFDGYQDQKVALLDDYGDGMLNIHYLKNILDRYAIDVPIKGGKAAWNPELIIITSNTPPELWYPNARVEDLAALRARMELYHFPSEKSQALNRLRLLTPPPTHQQPPIPMTIDIGSTSDEDGDTIEVNSIQTDHLSDLALPSLEWQESGVM